MNHFCEGCSHGMVNPKVKELFNKYVKKTFLHCPEDCEKVAGCLISNFEIDWEGFTEWCVKNKFIVEAKEADGTA